MNLFRIAAPLAAAVLALPAWAQTAQTDSTNRIDQRQSNQDQRMQRGEASGQLTNKEERRLEKKERHIQGMENRAAADGKVTPKERAKIERAQDRQSKRIARERQDNQERAAQGGTAAPR